MSSTSAGVVRRSCTAGASPTSMRSLACCSGRWKCGANDARRGDEIDDLPRAVHRLERADAEQHIRCPGRASATEQLEQRRTRGEVAAVGAQVHAGQRDLLESGRGDPRRPPRSTSASGTLRGRPRVDGMMQYEHGSAQPVWTRSVNAVRPATPGSIRPPQLPSPSPKRSACRDQLGGHCGTSRGLSSFGTTRMTFGSAADIRRADASRSSR